MLVEGEGGASQRDATIGGVGGVGIGIYVSATGEAGAAPEELSGGAGTGWRIDGEDSAG